MSGRFWSARQQLVVVSGEDGVPAQWLDATLELHIAVRDVLDLWEDQRELRGYPMTVDLDMAVETMRYALHQVRQWDVVS